MPWPTIITEVFRACKGMCGQTDESRFHGSIQYGFYRLRQVVAQVKAMSNCSLVAKSNCKLSSEGKKSSGWSLKLLAACYCTRMAIWFLIVASLA